MKIYLGDVREQIRIGCLKLIKQEHVLESYYRVLYGDFNIKKVKEES